jgi:hypothetical protein
MAEKDSRRRVTDLQFSKIVTKDGRKLGRVFDLRSPGVPEHGSASSERAVTEIVFGTIGLLQRLGLRQAKGNTLPWSSVVRIKAGVITVADDQSGEE